MNKKGMFIGVLLLIISAAMVGLSFNIPLQTDSGWDTDYSSGGSYSSSGSSDWSYSSDRSSSGGSGTYIAGSMYIMFGVIPILVIVFFALTSRKLNKFVTTISLFSVLTIMLGVPFYIKYNFYSKIFELLDNICLIIFVASVVIGLIYLVIAEIVKYIKGIIKTICEEYKSNKQISVKLNKYNYFGYHDLKQLLNTLYKEFVDVQKAWMNFDYDKLKMLCTDELFESYKSDLEVLKKKNGKNIMRFFIRKSIYIKNIKKNDDHYIIDLVLCVSFFDYVIDVNTKSVIRGKKWKLITNKYNLKFNCYDNKKVICPNCGSEIIGSECSYCHTHVDNNNSSFVLSEKKKIYIC